MEFIGIALFGVSIVGAVTGLGFSVAAVRELWKLGAEVTMPRKRS